MNNRKRHKTCINIHTKDGNLLEEYQDNVSCDDVVTMANKILSKMGRFMIHQIFNYMIIQKTFNTDQYGIRMVFSNCKDMPTEIADYFFQMFRKEFKVFSFQYTPDKSSPTIETPMYYLTDDIFLTDVYDGVKWNVSMDGFCQCYPYQGEEIHQTVNNILMEGETFVGLGGEMGYYYKANQNKYQRSQLFTNSKYIADECTMNDVEAELVNYEEFLMDINTDDAVLLINISRKGLKGLAQIINQKNFKQIVYIGCCEESVNRDLDILDSYVVKGLNRVDIDLNQQRFIVNLKKNW